MSIKMSKQSLPVLVVKIKEDHKFMQQIMEHQICL